MSKNQRDNVPATFERGPVEEAEQIVAETVEVPEETNIPSQQSGDDVTETGTDGETECEVVELKKRRFVRVTAFAKKNKKHIAIGALAATALGIAIKVVFSGVKEEDVPDVEHTPEVDGSVDES